jgi:hypothetical protein
MVRRAQKATHTPLPLPFPHSPWKLPSFEPDTIDEPLPLAPLLKNAEADVGTEMVTISVQFVAEPPKEAAKLRCKREYKETLRI